MNMKPARVLLSVITSASLLLIAAVGQRNEGQTLEDTQTAAGSSQVIQGTTYINHTAHFTLTVPSDWHVNTYLVRTTPSAVGAVAAPRGGVGILMQRWDYSVSPEAAKQALERAFSRGFPGYHKISETLMTIGGDRAPSFTFHYDRPPETHAHLPGKMFVVLIQNGHGILGVMCEAPEPSFDRLESTFKQIVLSYHYSASL